DLRRRAVRRVGLRGLAPHEPLARLEPRPAPLVRRDEVHVEMHGLDLPDAVFPHVRVLVDAVAPFGMLLVLAEHAVVAPPRRRAPAVLRDEDRRLQRQPFVELAVDQAFLAAVKTLEIFADPLLADVDAVEADLDGAVVGEQVRRLAPEAAVDVEPESPLQLLDGAGRLQLLDACGQCRDFRLDALALCLRGRREREGQADQDPAFHGSSPSNADRSSTVPQARTIRDASSLAPAEKGVRHDFLPGPPPGGPATPLAADR